MNPEFTRKIGDVRDRLTTLKSKDYNNEFNDNPVADALRINYVVHVQLLLDVIDRLIKTPPHA